MAEMEKLQGELQSAVADLRSTLEAQAGELKTFGEYTGETKGMFEKLNDRLDDLETKMTRPPVPAEPSEEERNSMAFKAFDMFLRKGESRVSPEYTKALMTDDDTTGGYFVPVQQRNRIIELLVEYSPIRSLVSVETISAGNTLEMPKEGTGTWSYGWVGERATRSETTTGTFAGESIPTHEMYAAPRVTQRMLDDAAFAVEEWMNRKVASRFSLTEGTAFISGTGVNQPEGILTHADMISTAVSAVAGGHATAITAEGLIKVAYALPDPYARNASWIMRRATIRDIRLLVDGVGRFLWEPADINSGTPGQILGRPYSECPDMPAIGAGTFPVVFADFRQLYLIVDRQGIRVVRDIYTAKPYIELYTTRRVGGQVILSEAGRVLKISAS